MMESENFLSKAKVRKLLGIGRKRYEQMIRSGLLPAPIKLSDEARPVHTYAQVERCRKNLLEESAQESSLQPLRKMKPLSSKLISEIR